MCVTFGDPRSRYRELRHKKQQILAWKVIYSRIIPKLLDVQSWNSGTMWVLMNALCKPSLGAIGHVTKILQTKKLTILNPYISVIIDIDEKWLVILEHTINHLSFGYVRLPQAEYYFSCFCIFFLTLLFLLRISTFKPLNAQYSEFEWFKISRRTSVRLKSEVPG